MLPSLLLQSKSETKLQVPTKIVDVDIDDEFLGDQEAYNRIEKNSNTWGLALKAIFVVGIIVVCPWPNGKPFAPELSILIWFPLAVYVMSYFYLKRVKNAFSLTRRLHPDTAVEEDKIMVYFEIKYKSILPFSIAYICDRCRATRHLGSPLTILKNNDFSNEGTLHLKYEVHLNRGYGKFDMGPMDLTVRDPFMFFKANIVLPLTTPITVWLNPPPEEDIRLINSSLLASAGSMKSVKAGSGLDFYGLKEYVPGDDVRAISWAKSAALGKTVLKQFERDTQPNVFIAIHSNRRELRGLGFGNCMKRIFRIAAAVIQETRDRGIPVKLALAQDKSATLTMVSDSVPAYGFMTDLLGNLEAAEPEASQPLLDEICANAAPNSIILFMSHTLNLDFDNLFDGFAALNARGVRIVLWVIDDSRSLNFSNYQQTTKIKPKEFIGKVQELGISFRLIDPKEQYAKDEAYKEAGRLMKQ